jgi:hypothetical protein
MSENPKVKCNVEKINQKYFDKRLNQKRLMEE